MEGEIVTITILNEPDRIEVIERPSTAGRWISLCAPIPWIWQAWIQANAVGHGGDLFSLTTDDGSIPPLVRTGILILFAPLILYALLRQLSGTLRDVHIWRFRHGCVEFITETRKGESRVCELMSPVCEIRTEKRKVDWPAWYRVQVYFDKGPPLIFPWQRTREEGNALAARLQSMFPEADFTSGATTVSSGSESLQN